MKTTTQPAKWRLQHSLKYNIQLITMLKLETMSCLSTTKLTFGSDHLKLYFHNHFNLNWFQSILNLSESYLNLLYYNRCKCANISMHFLQYLDALYLLTSFSLLIPNTIEKTISPFSAKASSMSGKRKGISWNYFLMVKLESQMKKGFLHFYLFLVARDYFYICCFVACF